MGVPTLFGESLNFRHSLELGIYRDLSGSARSFGSISKTFYVCLNSERAWI